MTCASDIAPEKVDCLWMGDIASGRLPGIVGEPGCVGRLPRSSWRRRRPGGAGPAGVGSRHCAIARRDGQLIGIAYPRGNRVRFVTPHGSDRSPTFHHAYGGERRRGIDLSINSTFFV